MLDYCVKCSRSVNTITEPSCYELRGVCLCKQCREEALAEGRAHCTQEESSDASG